MQWLIDEGVTCLAVPEGDWNDGTLERAVVYTLKAPQTFGNKDVVCTPDNPDAAGMWMPYALTGWYGFTRGNGWILLVRREKVQETPV